MSEQFIDFFMTITPTILTSVTGFLLGKYNYFQNRPLDKMEIAYKYFEYDEIQKLVKKYDSQARLTSYKMSMIKDFLGDEFSEKVDESFQYSLEDLQKINTQVDLVKSRIERIEKDLSSNEKEKTQNRIESERVNKKMLDIEKLWYENIFPDSYQGMFNRYVPSILSGKCPFCGTEHLDIKVNVENCFFVKR